MNWNTKRNSQLIAAILTLDTPDEAQAFLRDLMTESELQEFSKRLEAARLLSIETPYSRIVEQTGLSSTTVARVSKWLSGKLGGYRLVLDRLHHHPTTPVGSRGVR